MLEKFNARTNTLSPAQAVHWDQLRLLPPDLVLYGDTALCLRIGHRYGKNFEFKTAREFEPDQLRQEIPFLSKAKILERQPSHLRVEVGRWNPVEMTFDGGQTLKQLHPPERDAVNLLAVASLKDLAGEKIGRIHGSLLETDCRDIVALLYQGVGMDEMIGAAKAQRGERFDPGVPLKLLASVDRSDVRLDQELQKLLIKEAAATRLPALTPIQSERITTESQEIRRLAAHRNMERESIDFER